MSARILAVAAPNPVVVIDGRSGAGKSSLVRTINLLNRPTEGRVLVDGQDLLALDAQALRRTRRKIGMIFQHFNLLSSRTVFQIVYLGMLFAIRLLCSADYTRALPRVHNMG